METIFGMFAKQPIPGKVKTRLAAEIGPAAAAQLYAAFLADLVDRFRSVAERRVLGFSPASDEAAAYFHDLAAGRYELWVQPETSLGGRMESFFQGMLAADESGASSTRRVVLIGSDSPTLPRALVDDSFTALNDVDCVLGPATDGGFYLIGLRRWRPGLVDDVNWGTSRVLEQVARNAAAHNFSLHLLSPWYDVDALNDLQMLRGHLAAFRAAGQPDVAPQTAATLNRLCNEL